MTGGFSLLHPAVQHHVVNSLRWRELRPLQEEAIAPILRGDHALLCAPTAGGKTEAAILPLLSRMATDRWSGLSVLYVCPLRALLNNLHPRLDGYAQLVGRRAGLWHGDVGDADRRAILRDPPDILLTTPESLEAMFLSRRTDERALLGGVRAVVVDEIHAFAGDDRGWHALAVLARTETLAGRPFQRIGLTATVGNPDGLLDWLARGSPGGRSVVAPAADSAPPALEVDYVGSLDNAAKVVAALHRGEKRLVFCDSRAQVEELAVALRAREVRTFVSHSSLSRQDRRDAEAAFAEAADCVIVATSTLELGIDVGDLDRVIQVDAPARVASVLQRTGRTGRRAGTSRNCLFLTITDDGLLRALGLAALVEAGWVEPVVPPALPVHLLGQQLLARVLAEGRVARGDWPGCLDPVVETAGVAGDWPSQVADHAAAGEILFDDHGLLSIGERGERLYGRRHFMDVTSLFATAPLMAVRWGTRELGSVGPSALVRREHAHPVILLGGRAWAVQDVDWKRSLAWVQPADEPGRSRWAGGGTALSLEVCHAIRSVLAGLDAGTTTDRARARLGALRDELPGLRDGATLLAREGSRARSRWWTFAGGRANAELARRLQRAGHRALSMDDLGIALAGTPPREVLRELTEAAPAPPDPARRDSVKFGAAVPAELLDAMLAARDADPRAVDVALSEPVDITG